VERSAISLARKEGSAGRSRMMRAVKSSDTEPERRVAVWLEKARFKVERNFKVLPGSPDFVLRRRRLVIFIHGCFWHSHSCSRGMRKPKTNKRFWRLKLDSNRKRDRRNVAALKKLGWQVITIWACDLGKPSTRTRLIDQIRKAAR